MHPSQGGFRRGLTIERQLVLAQVVILDAKLTGRPLRMVGLDLVKAFDTIPKKFVAHCAASYLRRLCPRLADLVVRLTLAPFEAKVGDESFAVSTGTNKWVNDFSSKYISDIFSFLWGPDKIKELVLNMSKLISNRGASGLGFEAYVISLLETNALSTWPFGNAKKTGVRRLYGPLYDLFMDEWLVPACPKQEGFDVVRLRWLEENVLSLVFLQITLHRVSRFSEEWTGGPSLSWDEFRELSP